MANLVAQLAGANGSLNAILTVAESLLAFGLAPLGIGVFYPLIVSGQQGADVVPVGSMAASTAQIVVSLTFGLLLSSKANRIPRTVKIFKRLSLGTAITLVVTMLVLQGAPPITLPLAACVASLGAVGAVVAASLGIVTRQPLDNIKSMVLEVLVRDLAIVNAFILVGFSSAPFHYRSEAMAAGSTWALIINVACVSYSLLRPIVLACLGGVRAKPDVPHGDALLAHATHEECTIQRALTEEQAAEPTPKPVRACAP